MAQAHRPAGKSDGFTNAQCPLRYLLVPTLCQGWGQTWETAPACLQRALPGDQHTKQLVLHATPRVAHFFCKGPDAKYFRL